MVCPAIVRSEFQGEGQERVEIGAKGKKAAEEIRALWEFLDGNAKRLAVAKTKPKREAVRS
jgi:hypothetical protein